MSEQYIDLNRPMWEALAYSQIVAVLMALSSGP